MAKLKKEFIEVELNDIIPYENNNKVHTDKDVWEVIKSIQKDGYIAPIIVDDKNIILAWHGRKLALEQLWIEKIQVVKVYWLSEKQKKDYRIRDNTTNLLAEFNIENLKIELESLWDFSVDIVDHLNFDLNFNLFEQEDYNEEIEDEVPNLDNKKTIVKYWDIFQLWDHRLMFWDSTKKDEVEKLMNWELAWMIFTDPPYNVNYKGQGKITWTDRKIENDNMSDINFENFLNDTFDVYKNFIEKEAWTYVFHSTSTASIFEKTLKNNWFSIKNQLIWNKPSSALWWWNYRWKHEPFYYCWVTWNKINFYWDRTHATVIETLDWKSENQLLSILKRAKKAESEWKTTIWSMKRANVNEYLHPTQKPIELIEYALNNSSKVGDNILDLFWWSWSTLIASEKRQRKCFMMELDSTFVQTIIKRYHDTTNGKKEIICLNRKLDINEIIND